jgi:hypothetical protein
MFVIECDFKCTHFQHSSHKRKQLHWDARTHSPADDCGQSALSTESFSQVQPCLNHEGDSQGDEGAVGMAGYSYGSFARPF